METIFFACFVFGALFTVASIVLGFAGHGSAHLTSGHGASAHVGTHVGHGAHVDLPHAGTSADSARASHELPWLNASSGIGALTWFGAAGYLLTRLGGLALPAVILGAVLAGAIGWYLVARFLGLVLSGEREMDPEDYRLEGTVGTITVGIAAGGTGEVVFTKAGSRRSEAARALGGAPIARGSEVVITSYANGFATVQPWGEFLATREAAIGAQKREA
jgi:membrane protein implicated in regulation of membrane protease activity